MNNKTTHCEVCNQSLNSTAYYKHINSKKHNENLRRHEETKQQNPYGNDIPENLQKPLTPINYKPIISKLNKLRINNLERHFRYFSIKKLERELNKIRNTKRYINLYDQLLKRQLREKKEKQELSLQDFFKENNVKITERHGPGTHELKFNYSNINIEQFFNGISFDVRNQVRKYFNIGLKVTARLHCYLDRKSTRLNSSHLKLSRMPSSA